MKNWLRRVKSAIGMGLTWAAGWLPVGAVLGAVVGVSVGAPVGAVAVLWLKTFGVLGFLGGAIFSVVLRVAERAHRFEDLSLPRFTVWGAVGGLLLGGVCVAGGLLGAGWSSAIGMTILSVATLLGAASAVGTLAIARAGQPPSLPPGNADVRGLTDREKRDLLGAR